MVSAIEFLHMLVVSNSKRKPCGCTIAAHEALLLGLRFGIVLAGCMHIPGCEYLGGERWDVKPTGLAISSNTVSNPCVTCVFLLVQLKQNMPQGSTHRHWDVPLQHPKDSEGSCHVCQVAANWHLLAVALEKPEIFWLFEVDIAQGPHSQLTNQEPS